MGGWPGKKCSVGRWECFIFHIHVRVNTALVMFSFQVFIYQNKWNHLASCTGIWSPHCNGEDGAKGQVRVVSWWPGSLSPALCQVALAEWSGITVSIVSGPSWAWPLGPGCHWPGDTVTSCEEIPLLKLAASLSSTGRICFTEIFQAWTWCLKT